MKYTKLEMYSMLSDCIAIDEEALDIIIKVLGDTPETYKKILTKTTDFKSFEEVDKYYEIPGCI